MWLYVETYQIPEVPDELVVVVVVVVGFIQRAARSLIVTMVVIATMPFL